MQEYNWLFQAGVTVALTFGLHYALLRERLVALESQIKGLHQAVEELKTRERKTEHQLIKVLTKLKMETAL